MEQKFICTNKKVLLCDRKKHTALCVASTPVVLAGGDTPIPGWVVPYPRTGGYPILGWYPPFGTGQGTPPHLDLAGVPPPPPRTETITFPHPSDAGGNKQWLLHVCHHILVGSIITSQNHLSNLETVNAMLHNHPSTSAWL